MTSTNLVEIFCILDEFCKYFTLEVKKHTLEVPGKCRRNRPQCMFDSEIMTIPVIFHTRHYRDLKSFCLCHVCRHMRNEFPKTVSYNRFVERQAQVALHLLLFLQTCALGKCTGISIIAPPVGIMSYQTYVYAQNHERMGGQGKVYDGMVLWIQATSGHQ